MSETNEASVQSVVRHPLQECITEYIHDVAKNVITNPPNCVDKTSRQAVLSYQVGVLELAKALTGQTAIEADREAVKKYMERVQDIDTLGW